MRPRKDSTDLILGGKQLAILQTVFCLGDDAYGGGVYVALSEDGDHTSLPQIYSVLEKLERKGLVVHKFSAPQAKRGGRRRKVYSLTGTGEKVRRMSILNNPRLGNGEGWLVPGFGVKRQT